MLLKFKKEGLKAPDVETPGFMRNTIKTLKLFDSSKVKIDQLPFVIAVLNPHAEILLLLGLRMALSISSIAFVKRESEIRSAYLRRPSTFFVSRLPPLLSKASITISRTNSFDELMLSDNRSSNSFLASARIASSNFMGQLVNANLHGSFKIEEGEIPFKGFACLRTV